MKKNQPTRPGDLIVLALGVVFALYVRYAFRGFVTSDFTYFTSLWYAAVQQQGIGAAGTGVSNYSPPYLYILYLTSALLPSVTAVAAIKIPSIACDLLCAWFVSRIVRLKYAEGPIPMFAFLAALLAPTIVTNGAVWGQADSIYTSMLLACVYFLMTGRSAYAAVAFGVGLSLKFQAMFLAPAICALWLRRVVPFQALLLVPVVYVVMMIPAWMAGRPLADLATIYFSQSVTFHSLTMNAPNMYTWLPGRLYGVLVVAGLLLMTCVGAWFVWTTFRSRARIDQALILKLSLLSLIMTPFFLPKMHDRFFFPADVLSIAYGFFFPKQYYVPVAISFVSFFAYQPYLIGRPIIPLGLLALVMLAALLSVAWSVRLDLASAPCCPRGSRGPDDRYPSFR